MSYLRRILAPLCALFLANALTADTLSGRVVDANGNGIAGVQLDITNLAGPDPIVTGDETDALGNFAATLPAGLYRVVFEPPAPPLSTLLPAEIESILVTGVSNVGTISLELGVSVSGRLLDTSFLPVFNVDLDVRDEAIAQDLVLLNDNSDPQGNFTVVVPRRPVFLQIDPSTVQGVLVLAPQERELDLVANINLGDIILQPGFTISGVVLDDMGLPLVDADFDFEDILTSDDIYTPGDNTDAFGVFSIIVPTGTYNVTICPPEGVPLVPRAFAEATVVSDVAAGIVTLEFGVVLTGTITDCSGAPAVGVDIDLRTSPAFESVPLCDDNTDLSGNYSVVVPPGTYHVIYSSPTLGTTGFNAAVPVFTNTVSNGNLECCPSPGSVVIQNGSGINPVLLTTLNTPSVGGVLNFQVDATGFSPDVVVVVAMQGSLAGIPGPAGELLINPSSEFAFSLSAMHSGAPVQLSGMIPPNAALCGRTLFAQGIMLQGATGQLTNALAITPGQ